jgi:uncharacterized protein (TIGR00661 family)
MSLPQTVRRNLHCIPFFFRNGSRLMRELREFEPDAFITAYEPFTMVASHVMGKPLISMDNQNELLHVKAPPGTFLPALWLVQLATRACTFGARYYVIKSLAKPHAGESRFRFVSPVIQDEIRSLHSAQGRHVLVYLTKPNRAVLEMFKSMNETFIVYCGRPPGTDGNVHYRAQGATFLQDLGACKAIVGTTGFSLISDSIFLKKPYFGVPLRGQFEQTYNAHFLRELGIGEYSESPTRPDLEKFLGNLAGYRARLEEYHLDPAEQEETLLAVLREISATQARPVPVSQDFPAHLEEQDPVEVHAE